MSKRGISPLIATVLIIGFTVALGVIILLWSSGFIKGMQERAESTEGKASTCAAATVKVEEVEQTAPSRLRFLLENTGKADVKSVIVRVTGDAGTVSVNKPGLKSAGKKSYKADFDVGKVGVISSVEVIPTVDIEEKNTPCAPGVVMSSDTPQELDDYWDAAHNDGTINLWEECDAAAVPKFPLKLDEIGLPIDCTDFGYGDGFLGCTEYGTIDISGCTGYGVEGATTCGNFRIDNAGAPSYDGEQCDLDVNGFPIMVAGVDCVLFGFAGGELSCTDDCMIDLSFCTDEVGGEEAWGDYEQWATCRDGIIQLGEDCDGTNLGNPPATCSNRDSGSYGGDSLGRAPGGGTPVSPTGDPLGRPPGSQPGGAGGLGRTPGGGSAPDPLACNLDCTFDVSGCPV